MRNSDPDFLWGHLLTNGLCLVSRIALFIQPTKKKWRIAMG